MCLATVALDNKHTNNNVLKNAKHFWECQKSKIFEHSKTEGFLCLKTQGFQVLNINELFNNKKFQKIPTNPINSSLFLHLK